MGIRRKPYISALCLSLLLLSTFGISAANAASLQSTKTETIHVDTVKVKAFPLTQQECVALAKEQHILVVKTCTAQLVARVSGVGTRSVRRGTDSQVSQLYCLSGTFLAEGLFDWDGRILFAEQRATVHYDGSCNLPRPSDISNHNCWYNYGSIAPNVDTNIVNCATYTTTDNVAYIEQDMYYKGEILSVFKSGTVWDTITFVDGDGDWDLNQSPSP